MRLSSSLLTGVLLLAGCGGDPLPGEPAPPPPTAPPPTTPAPSPAPAAPPAAAPRFGEVFAQVLSQGGCTNGYCHGSSGGLSMSAAPDKIYAALVGAPSRGVDCPGAVRVVPGNPADSLLWRKLSPEAPACGKKMPWGLAPLPAEKLDLVRRWIEGGALP
jgi:hypothetical protein